MHLRFIVIIAAALAYGNQSRAEIVSAGPSGFNLREVAEVPNPAPVVWAMLSDIGKWWDPEHTYSGDSRNLTLEPFVRGCFCEKLSLYAGIEHATVIYAQPAKTLRLSGAPAQAPGELYHPGKSRGAEARGTQAVSTR